MKFHLDSYHFIDVNEPIDLSIELSNDAKNPTAWYVDPPQISPIINEQFIGSVNLGGSVNFNNITFNPHGHGTHTECLGHITQEVHSVNDALKKYFFRCHVVTVRPKIYFNEQYGAEDHIITRENFMELALSPPCDAIAVRTLPNDENKKSKNYSSSNPPYLDTSCFDLFYDLGIQHLLIDLPSIDREIDSGVLAGHHKFWEVPSNPQMFKTITEMIYIPNSVVDGEYILELQMASFKNDAAPSRPVLYEIKKSVLPI